MSAREAMQLAHKHGDLALKTDPGHSFAMVVSAFLKMADWKWNEGFELLQRALEINPNDSAAHMMAAEFYVLFMDPEKELKHATLAFQLDPLSANTMGETARHYLTAGKPKEALALAEEALLLDPHNLVSRSIRAYATAMTGNPQEGLKQMLEIYTVTGDHPLVLLGIGNMYAWLNEKEKVKEIIAKIEAMMEQMPEANLDFMVAMLSADIGDMEKFRRSYDRAIEKKAQWIVQFYGSEMSRAIWYDEHVIATRKKLGLPVYEREVKAQ
jgi:tetratricopeptide (TPR) repeat protein